MRRWNGWGDEAETAHVGASARRFLERRLGPPAAPRDATIDAVVARVPQSRLDPVGGLLDTDPELRVRRARGQSFPDLVALRSGRLEAVPDAVAHPTTNADVRRLIEHARSVGARLIPYGGGTSVVGGVTARPSADPLITVDLSALNELTNLDERSGLVTVGAGMTGPALAEHLEPHGLTIGHEPQSFELATVGGWVAARGSGLRSFGSGRIEGLFAGGTLEAPAGTMTMSPFPASAAGPDLRQLVLGSEGRLGFLTDTVLRTSPLPEVDRLRAYALPGWAAGHEAVRALAQARTRLSVLRLSTPVERQTLLGFADKPDQVRLLKAYLQGRGVPRDWSLLLVGVAGSRRAAAAASREARAILGAFGGVAVPALAGTWAKTRFRSPYLRTSLWELGYGSDTLETATTWANVPRLLARLQGAVSLALSDQGERVHVFTHLSHLYPTGSSLYLTYLFRLAPEPDETIARWTAIKRSASAVIEAEGATITHHHGVGVDHAPYLAAEKGPLGMAALEAIVRTFDPDGLMNPGVLLSDRHG
ncbi:MAG TPA: FAD-binding oxidoreductase [Candidatus Limnocylindrales bacterium]|nr:FAD-binding oxidoreductase [Candidatus Limnocylindrales bacterium]